MSKKLIAFIVPAHNEELVIASTLASVLRVSRPEDIYVIDDGSRDKTAEISRQMGVNVFTLPINHGKANAINVGISHFEIPAKYELLMPVDADTQLGEDFVEAVQSRFDNDSEIVAVAGRVVGKTRNWLTAYRVWEYEVGQSIHKSAQSLIGGIVVCPGCATVYRSQLFTVVGFPKGTLTEDMDLTYEIHRRKLGKIVYEPNAVVITQDPATMNVWIKQLKRWYGGFWQCVVKHDIPWGGQMLDFESGLAAIEGLFNGLLVGVSVILLPMGILSGQYYVLLPLLIDFILFFVPSMLWVSVRHRDWSIWKYSLHFYFCRFVSSGIFMLSFVKILYKSEMHAKFVWNTERYLVK